MNLKTQITLPIQCPLPLMMTTTIIVIITGDSFGCQEKKAERKREMIIRLD